MIIILSLALFSINSISAATGNQTENITNSSEIQQNITDITDSNATNFNNTTSSNNTTSIHNSTEAAGGSSYSKVKGIWLKAESVSNLNVTTLKKLGITDVFIKCNLISTPTYSSVLTAILKKLQGTNIRVHAWITCFIDANGNWVNPTNTTQQTKLLNAIKDIVKNYNVSGVNLDYVRYPGTAHNYTNATATITSFVQKVYNTVKSINSSVAVSADVMPEGSMNAYYYGQNYTQLAKYLDFMVPMIYKGNYGYSSSTGTNSKGQSGTSWIGSTVKYIVSQTNGIPVIACLQTYRSDSNVTAIPASELQNDINAAVTNGSSGYALFRYGLINSAFSVDSTAPTVISVDPANNAVNVPINKTIKVTFSEPIKAGTLAVGVKNLKTGTYISITKTISGNTLTIKPTSNLTKGTQYSIILNAGSITDLAGNTLKAYTTKFTTDSTIPTVKSVDPANNTVNILINKVIKVTFSESIKAGTLSIYLKNLNTGTYVPITKTISSNVLTLTPTSNLTKGTQYSIILNAGSITDLAGNPLNSYSCKFTTNGTAFTITQVNTAAASVKSYVESYHKLPNYVTIGTSQVTMPQFLKLLATSLLQINNGTNTPMIPGSVKAPTSSTGSYMYGNIVSSEYLSIAQKIKSYINSNGIAPNYFASSLGNVRYESLVYIYSKILNYYKTNGKLPNYVLVDSSVTNTTIPSSLQQYLQATTNCQVTNSQIQTLAKSLANNKFSAYDKAVAIFNWVRDNIGYSFYYNTKYGAIGTLNAKTGNCVDTAHLLIALERAAGIPARYEHVYAQFSSGNWYGHVIAQVWVNGKWYDADATSSSNTFGAIKNWNTATATYYGTYATLPF